MNLEQKVLICYNEPVRYYDNYLGKDVKDSKEDTDLSEREFLKQIELIKKSLKKRYMSVETLAVNRDIKSAMKRIINFSPDLIFNFVESVEGNSNLESYVAGMFDLLGIPYTGNGAISLGNCLIKSRTKQILDSHGIRTPKHAIIAVNELPKKSGFVLKFPVILKLAREDASIGISEDSVVHNFADLNERLKYLFTNFTQDVLIEEYIDGRELNVAILGDQILPISEIRFDGLPDQLPKIVTYEAKWSPESVYYKNTVPSCPAVLAKPVRQKVEKMAKEAFEALECRDYARVDIRLNHKNVPYVIEINPNPDISPDTGFVRSANAANINYDELLYKISQLALKRSKYDTQIAI
jgi:D-alanine-D-alanine ligase